MFYQFNLDDLLIEFERITGYPILLNTSFNIKDKTMVLTPKDAIETFYDTDMDILVLNNYIIYKQKIMKKLINWVKKLINERKRKKEFKKKLEELRKRDPFIYRHQFDFLIIFSYINNNDNQNSYIYI